MAANHARQEPVLCEEAMPCPFCGAKPFIQPWHGGGAQKKMLDCQNENCHVGPTVTGANRQMTVKRWNTRVTAEQVEASREVRSADSGYSDAHLVAFSNGALQDEDTRRLRETIQKLSIELYTRRRAMGDQR